MISSLSWYVKRVPGVTNWMRSWSRWRVSHLQEPAFALLWETSRPILGRSFRHSGLRSRRKSGLQWIGAERNALLRLQLRVARGLGFSCPEAGKSPGRDTLLNCGGGAEW